MTLIEVLIALPIVVIAIGMFLQMFTAGTGLRKMGRDDWLASGAAQAVLEQMRNEEFREVFSHYNADPFDDPGGPGTSAGNTFDVPGLDPVAGTAGPVGEVVLPCWNLGTEVAPDWQLREDFASDELGMPRDLTGDILVDGEDHGDDYTLLPIIVRLRWQGRSGPRELELHTIFAEQR